MQNDYFFEIVTITYRDLHGLKDTISSLHHQTFSDYVHTIVVAHDDEETLEFLGNIPEGPRRILFQNGQGIGNAFNTALPHLLGRYVNFLNSGDIYYDSCVLEKVAQELQSHPAEWLVGGVVSRSKRKQFTWSHRPPDRFQNAHFLKGNPICHQATFYAKTLIRKVGFYDESLSLEMDFDWNLRCFALAQPKTVTFFVVFYDASGRSSVQPFKHIYWHWLVSSRHLSNIRGRKIYLLRNIFKSFVRFCLIPLKTYF